MSGFGAAKTIHNVGVKAISPVACVGGSDDFLNNAVIKCGVEHLEPKRLKRRRAVLGWDSNDVLRGGAGADRLDGGTGTDIASYFESSVGVKVNLAAGTGVGGDAQGDILIGIEVLSGSQGNDGLIGSSGANTLRGWDGSDVLRGGAEADVLDGGAGIDTASYYDGSVGVTVSLAAGIGVGGDAQGDTLTGIENLSGSQGNDILTGNAGANTLQGWDGDDVLVGGTGKDSLIGGAGGDQFRFIALSDSVVGANADVSHAQADLIDLAAIDANTAVAGDQAFTFIGSAHYTGVAGQLRYSTSGGVTTVAGDVDGDSVSDLHIELTGGIVLVAADLVLSPGSGHLCRSGVPMLHSDMR